MDIEFDFKGDPIGGVITNCKYISSLCRVACVKDPKIVRRFSVLGEGTEYQLFGAIRMSCFVIQEVGNVSYLFLVAPAAESRAERLIFSVWRLLGCMFACLLQCRQRSLFQILPPGGIQG